MKIFASCYHTEKIRDLDKTNNFTDIALTIIYYAIINK